MTSASLSQLEPSLPALSIDSGSDRYLIVSHVPSYFCSYSNKEHVEQCQRKRENVSDAWNCIPLFVLTLPQVPSRRQQGPLCLGYPLYNLTTPGKTNRRQ